MRKTIVLIITLLLIFGISTAVLAQFETDLENNFQKEFSDLDYQNPKIRKTESSNKAQLIQKGNNNFSLIKQSGEKNQALTIQNGNFNRAEIRQTGTSNSAVIKQFSDNNIALITQTGSSNEAVILQN